MTTYGQTAPGCCRHGVRLHEPCVDCETWIDGQIAELHAERRAERREAVVPALTLGERVEAYNHAYAKYPSSHLRIVKEQGRPVIYGTWLIGNDYRQTAPFYGAYPPSYLERVGSMFPDIVGAETLHAFAGSLPAGPYVRLDLKRDDIRQPDIVGNVLDVAALVGARRFRLTYADPPYSKPDAVFYATPMISRRKAVAAIAEVTRPGGFLVWLDVCWPMHAKSEWITVGRIALIRSTNHRVRLVSIFQRAA